MLDRSRSTLSFITLFCLFKLVQNELLNYKSEFIVTPVRLVWGSSEGMQHNKALVMGQVEIGLIEQRMFH